MWHGPFGQIACFRAGKNALMNKSRSDLLDGSSIKQDKETEFIPNALAFRIMFWIYLIMFSFVNFFG